jgi:hypothetical protein
VRAAGLRCAADRIPRIDLDDMFVDVILMHMVEVAVVKIVDMPIMVDRGMSTVWAVLMGMVGMMLFGTNAHDFSSMIEGTRPVSAPGEKLEPCGIASLDSGPISTFAVSSRARVDCAATFGAVDA